MYVEQAITESYMFLYLFPISIHFIHYYFILIIIEWICCQLYFYTS